jgi:hypothetical protein
MKTLNYKIKTSVLSRYSCIIKKNQLFDLVVEGQGSNGLDFIRDVKS